MNKIYRTVWSDTLQSWVAVAENAPSRGKRGGSKVGTAALVVIAAAMGTPAFAADMQGVPEVLQGVSSLLNGRLTDGAMSGVPVASGVVEKLMQPVAATVSSVASKVADLPQQSQTAAALSGVTNTVRKAVEPVRDVVEPVRTAVEPVRNAVTQLASLAPQAPSLPALVPAISNNAANNTLALTNLPSMATMFQPTPNVALANPTVPSGTVPPPLNTPAPTGLVIGTAGLLGGLGQGLAPLTKAAFNSQDDWLRSGALSVNRDNINARFSIVNVLGVPILDLAPVTGALAGTLGGTLPDQKLTLLGGVTSGNYITNINSGLTYKNGLLLPQTTPPPGVTPNNCGNLLGIVGATCWNVPAAQNNQVLIGDGAAANGSQEVVIGTGAQHQLPNEDANTIFVNGVPTTDYSQRKGYSVVIGDNAFGNANAQTIIGAGAASSVAGGVALGYQSVADRTGSGVEAFSKTAVPVEGTVSVGSAGHERQITNVAGGTAATDAVNVRQLTAVSDQINGIDANSVKYDGTDKKVATLGGGAGGTRVTNLTAGTVSATSTDAVNGAQLNTTNQNVTTITNRVTDIDVNGTKYFRANTTLAGAAATGTDSVAAGGASAASAANSVALGSNANASMANSVALGAGSTTSVGAQTGYAAYGLTALQNSAGEVSVGSAGAARKITNVAAGSDDTDAANIAQLKSVNKSIDDLGQLAVKYDDSSKTVITLNSGGASTRITNVAKGAETSVSTDAINGSQLWDWTQNTSNAISNTSLFNLIKNSTANTKYFQANSTLGGATASGTDSVAVGPQATSGGANSVAVGNGSSTSGDNAVAVGGSAKASAPGATAVGSGSQATGANSTALGSNSTASADNSVALGNGSVADRANSVSVGAAGHERQITNVADGTQDTDAANIRQLKAVSGDVTNISNGTDGMFQTKNDLNRAKPTPTGSDSVAGGAGAVASGAASTALGNASVASGANTTAVGNSAVASGNNAVALGNGSQALGTGGTAMGTGAQVSAPAVNGVAMGTGAQATAGNSVALGAGSIADRAGSVSVGSSGNERQITNVKAGTAPTDAVNVQQLQNATSGFGDSIDGLRNDLNKVKRNAYAGAAAAMAVAGLPQAYAPGRSMASAAGSYYLGQSAIAVGVSTVSENGRWVYKLAGNVNSTGEVGAVVGAGYQW